MDSVLHWVTQVPGLWWSGLSFFVGLLVGHRLQLGLARRLDRQAAREVIRAWVIDQGGFPDQPVRRPSDTQFDAFASRISKRQRKRLGAACRGLTASWTMHQDAAGQLSYTVDRELYLRSMSTLLDITKPE